MKFLAALFLSIALLSVAAGAGAESAPGPGGPPTVLIAHFVTTEGDPYPFDFTISDGFTVQTFDSVTYVETEVPDTADYTASYAWYGPTGNSRLEAFSFRLGLEPGTTKEIEIYAFDLYSRAPREPVVSVKEVGASVSLSWSYEETSDSTAMLITEKDVYPPGAFALLSAWMDTSLIEAPQYMIKSLRDEVARYTPGEYYDSTSTLFWHIGIGNWSFGCRRWCLDGEINYHKETAACTADGSLRWSNVVGVRGVTHNFSRVGPYDLTLQKLGGTLADPGYLYPQFHIPTGQEGSYLLHLFGLPPDYARMDIPVDVVQGDYAIFDLYPPVRSDLLPYTFGVGAETFVGTSSYSNLLVTADSISVEVGTALRKHGWWGYFVLPDTVTVGALYAYSDSGGVETLTAQVDYTIRNVDDYDIVMVRISPHYTRLKLVSDMAGITGPDGTDLPATFVLYRSHPNPFDDMSEIEYALPRSTRVNLAIYNIMGQRVITLVDEEQTEGYRTAVWDGRNDHGKEVSGGIYFCRFQAGDYSEVRRLVLLR